MGEQDDKIFEYRNESHPHIEGAVTGRRKLCVRWDVLLSVIVERIVIQAGSLGTMLASVVWWAQSRGGLC